MQYLARFETDTGDLCLGLVRFPAAPRLAAFYPDRWFRVVERLGHARVGLSRCAVSVRACLRAGQLDQLVMFRTPAAAERELRHYLASFLELLALADESVELPMNREAHDGMARSTANYLCRLEQPVLRTGAAWIACDFRLLEQLPDLLETAAAAGHDLFYQANLQPWVITAEHERRARYNWVALSGLRGIPSALLELQTRMLHRQAGAVQLLDEYVGTFTLPGKNWLEVELRRRFAGRYGHMRLEPPTFSFTENQFGRFLRGGGSPESEAVETGVHLALLTPPTDAALFADALDDGTADEAFHWSGGMRRWFEPPLAAQQDRLRAEYEYREGAEKSEASAVAAKAAGGPTITTNTSDYAFISYRRSDFVHIEPLLGGLNAANCPFWFDRGIPGGSHWMSVLQERIANARAVLLFLSREAADSRYVRLEINYAYSLGKPVLPVRMEKLDIKNLPGGLGLLLNSLNAVDARLETILACLRGYGF